MYSKEISGGDSFNELQESEKLEQLIKELAKLVVEQKPLKETIIKDQPNKNIDEMVLLDYDKIEKPTLVKVLDKLRDLYPLLNKFPSDIEKVVPILNVFFDAELLNIENMLDEREKRYFYPKLSLGLDSIKKSFNLVYSDRLQEIDKYLEENHGLN